MAAWHVVTDIFASAIFIGKKRGQAIFSPKTNLRTSFSNGLVPLVNFNGYLCLFRRLFPWASLNITICSLGTNALSESSSMSEDSLEAYLEPLGPMSFEWLPSLSEYSLNSSAESSEPLA